MVVESAFEDVSSPELNATLTRSSDSRLPKLIDISEMCSRA